MYFSLRLLSLRFISGIALALLPIVSIAQDDTHAQLIDATQISPHQFQVKLGILYTWVDSNIDISSANIDYESDLNLDEQTLNPSIEASWTYNNKHYFTFNYFSLRREGQKSSSKELDFGNGNIIERDSVVDSYLNTDFYQLSYGYDFLQNEKWALGASVGLHFVGIETEIKSRNDISEKERQFIYQDTSLPLPNIGLFTHYQLNEKWRLAARIQYFYIATDTLYGGLTDLAFAAVYQINPNWSVNGALRYENINFNDEWLRLDTELTYVYYGPSLSVAYTF